MGLLRSSCRPGVFTLLEYLSTQKVRFLFTHSYNQFALLCLILSKAMCSVSLGWDANTPHYSRSSQRWEGLARAAPVFPEWHRWKWACWAGPGTGHRQDCPGERWNPPHPIPPHPNPMHAEINIMTVCLSSIEWMFGSNHPAFNPASAVHPCAWLPIPVLHLSFAVPGWEHDTRYELRGVACTLPQQCGYEPDAARNDPGSRDAHSDAPATKPVEAAASAACTRPTAGSHKPLQHTSSTSFSVLLHHVFSD